MAQILILFFSKIYFPSNCIHFPYKQPKDNVINIYYLENPHKTDQMVKTNIYIYLTILKLT